ncbi:hypothetical protein WOLCODRAFT_82233, partial [Wolfiporia cocos MD-104 SS10]
YEPFPNASLFMLMEWVNSSSNLRSSKQIEALLQILIHSDFDIQHLIGINIACESSRLDEFRKTNGALRSTDGWIETSVHLHVPKEGIHHTSEDQAPMFEVHNIHYCPLLDIITAAFQGSDVDRYHWAPHRQFWHSGDSEAEYEDTRIYSELFNSNAMLEEDTKIQAVDPNPDDPEGSEAAMVPIMLWSDSTHLASFGSASLWPIYAYFGNPSKYICGWPSAHAAHHLAYMPPVSA